MRQIYLLGALLIGFLSLELTRAQSQSPVVVQAAPPATAQTPATKPSPNDSAETLATTKLLQDMIATNETLLQKQEATLQNLDALQKAAQEIKIFSKRG